MPDKGKEATGAEGIASQIPHRYPFLMLDRIVEQSPGRCVAVKNVTVNEWYFQGHFPGQPIMPGALLTEAMAQAGNFLGRQTGTEQQNPPRVKEAFLLSAETKYIRPVVPGDQVVITARIIRKDGNIVRFKSEAHVLGELVASGYYVAMVKEDVAP